MVPAIIFPWQRRIGNPRSAGGSLVVVGRPTPKRRSGVEEPAEKAVDAVEQRQEEGHDVDELGPRPVLLAAGTPVVQYQQSRERGEASHQERGQEPRTSSPDNP